METLNKLVDQGKTLVNQLTSSDSAQPAQPAAAPAAEPQAVSETTPTGADTLVPDVGDSLGVTGGVDRLTSDQVTVGGARGVDAAGSGETGSEPAYSAYSTAGRDPTGTFDGGANDPPNLGPGEMPK